MTSPASELACGPDPTSGLWLKHLAAEKRT